MLTVGRNIALGLGMSTANGTIPTNGIQPLYTFVISGLSLLANCDKMLTVKLVTITQLLISLAGFFLITKIGKKMFVENKNAQVISLFAAAIWFCNPITVLNTTNGLETGFYTLLILVFIYFFIFKIKTFTWKIFPIAGAGLGVIFWARNDAVFLISAICLAIIFFRLYDKQNIYKNILAAVVTGTAAFVVALPWMLYNLKFGSLMPLSGHAEMGDFSAVPNLKYITAVFTEYFLLFYQIPILVKDKISVVILTTIISLTIFFLTFKKFKNFTGSQKQIFFILFIFLVMLSLFYGIFFRTYYFLERYLFPVSPFIYLFWAAFAVQTSEKIRYNTVKYFAALFFALYMLAVSYRNYQHDYQFAYANFADWAEKNVKEEEWLGSYQTGVLGYYHDKTINLDGKVNPEALKANEENKLSEYVASKKIDFLIDIVHLASWKKNEVIDKNYDLIVEDFEKNIAVFRRKDYR